MMKEFSRAIRFLSTQGVSLGVFLACCSALLSCSPPSEPAGSEQPALSEETLAASASTADSRSSGDEIGQPGGRLVFAVTSDPRTFNPAIGLSGATLKLLDLLHEDLMGFDPLAQTVRPSLAESWTALPPEGESPAGTRYRMSLRRDLRFSDGESFDAEDVLFTVKAILDPDVGSPQRETLMVGDEPISLKAIDSHTLEVHLAAPVADAGMLFDRLYIMPEHRLSSVYEGGSLGSAWGAESRLSEIVGLGPFRLKDYLPGERITLERNPYFWARDAQGQKLPYLDEVVVLIVPDKQAGLLRLEAGEIEMLDNLPVEGFEQLQASSSELGLEMRDLGAGTAYEFLFFNLNQVDTASNPELARKQGWFRDLGFRKSIAHAIDRQGIVDLVYGGRATAIGTHTSPGNRRWHEPSVGPPETSIPLAKRFLTEAGFTWDAGGKLLDADGIQVKLTIVTNSTNPRRVQTATVVQEDLNRLGMEIQVAAMDFGALLDRVGNTFDYEIGLIGLGRGGIDPSSDLNVWHSSGSNHLWHLGAECPTTEWEQRIDDLMSRQVSELDAGERKETYDEVQALVAEYLPVVVLVAPNVLVGADKDLGNFAPTIFEPPILWNVERLYRRPAHP